AWGEAKKQLFELINAELAAPRERYNELMENRDYLETALQQGAEKARIVSSPLLAKVKAAVGLKPIA
ncbi:MAG: tryptophan--tRNA ligase, partial [Pseudomonadales bacterium]|nr:tryptophan--tRNA ligase [Pseudomonadales bacterium]